MNVQCSQCIVLLQRYFYDFLVASITNFIPVLLQESLLCCLCFTYTYTANGKRQIQNILKIENEQIKTAQNNSYGEKIQ